MPRDVGEPPPGAAEALTDWRWVSRLDPEPGDPWAKQELLVVLYPGLFVTQQCRINK